MKLFSEYHLGQFFLLKLQKNDPFNSIYCILLFGYHKRDLPSRFKEIKDKFKFLVFYSEEILLEYFKICVKKKWLIVINLQIFDGVRIKRRSDSYAYYCSIGS